MRTRWRLPALAGATVVAGLVAGGGTFALWNTSGSAPEQIITAGNLDIESGSTTWTETSADVATAPHTIDPATFLVRQGDTVEASYEFTTHLQGDNMLGELTVDWTDSAGLPSGVSGTYQLYDGDHTPLMASAAALGTATTLDGTEQLDADDAGREDTFTVAITLDFADLADRFGADSAVQLADLGNFEVTLDQVRSGEGFQ